MTCFSEEKTVIKQTTPSLYIYPDGREVCRDNQKGKAEYRWRKLEALYRQKGLCAICHQNLPTMLATMDHIKPRKMGASERDDRQENIRAVHALCNSEKGSKR
jgi:5-methylcytosine-specific restriction endonuclease McrA